MALVSVDKRPDATYKT